MAQRIPISQVKSVTFTLTGQSEAARESSTTIKTYETIRNGQPLAGGIYDPKTGTFTHDYNCETCHHKKGKCLGHEGVLEVKYPIINPLAVEEITKWLKLICFNCGRILVREEQFMFLPPSERFARAINAMTSATSKTTSGKLAEKARTCLKCHTPFYPVKRPQVSGDPTLFVQELPGETKPIYPHEVMKILSRVSDETISKLGFNPASHVRNFVLMKIKIPPVTTRPDIKKLDSANANRSTNKLSSYIQNIIKESDKFTVDPLSIDVVSEDLRKMITRINTLYYDFVRSSSEKDGALGFQLYGKTGRLRGNLLGKRCFGEARSTITESPKLEIDEVEIPIEIAKTLQREEIVQEFNIERLSLHVRNGTKEYPGATSIKKFDKEYMTNVDGFKGELQYGDVVLRDYIDGDYILYNRQPSLKPSNICAVKVKINASPDFKPFRMNFLICPYFNADFDGDAMTGISLANSAACIEGIVLCNAGNFLVDQANSSVSIGLTEDTLIGIAELTKSNVKISRERAYSLFADSKILPTLPLPTISGRDIISILLAKTPINISRKASFYNPNLAKYIEYEPDDIGVKIVRGKHISGILDKSTVGKGVSQGLYHIIANEYDPKEAMNVMFNMQQIGLAFMTYKGVTLGMDDINLPYEVKKEVDEITNDLINKSEMMVHKLNMGEVIPPIGKTVKEFYENSQINILTVCDDYIRTVIGGIDVNENSLYRFSSYGSKGKLEYLLSMVSAVGQRVIDNERVGEKFGWRRTTPYNKRYDEDPEARGFISNSYIRGLSIIDTFADAMFARKDLIRKALNTSVTGEHNRKAVNCLNESVTDNYRFSAKETAILSLAYGDNFLDSRKVEKVKFPSVMMSNAKFEEIYANKQFAAFVEKIKKERKKYRKYFLSIERANDRAVFSDECYVGVNVWRVIDNIIKKYREGDGVKATEAELKKIVEFVDDQIDRIPYVLLNSVQEKARRKIPENVWRASFLLRMLVRSLLHPNFIAAQNLTMAMVQIIFAEIRTLYIKSIIDSGYAVGMLAGMSFCEPLTQFMLSPQKVATGRGSGKTNMIKVKELLNMKKTKDLKVARMVIPLRDDIASNKDAAQEVADKLEMTKLIQFVSKAQVFYEKFGDPQHHLYADEKKIIEDFIHFNPILKPPVDLIGWCIRIELNKSTLIIKSMDVETIIRQLRVKFPELYIVYTSINAKNIILRIYVRSTFYKQQATDSDLIDLLNRLIDTEVRGLIGIRATSLMQLIRHVESETGEITNKEVWGVAAEGLNMDELYHVPEVETSGIMTNAILKVYQTLGIEAARNAIIASLREIIDINYCHYCEYANEMTHFGSPTSLSAAGLARRESNTLLRAGLSSPVSTLSAAAISGRSDLLGGVAAPLILGTVPQIGSAKNKIVINQEFLEKNIKDPDRILEELFD